MRTEEILILGREDLKEYAKDEDLFLIEYVDFKISYENLEKNTIILFIDDNGNTRIIKNRYGDKGENVFISYLEREKIANIDIVENMYIDKIIDIFKR